MAAGACSIAILDVSLGAARQHHADHRTDRPEAVRSRRSYRRSVSVGYLVNRRCSATNLVVASESPKGSSRSRFSSQTFDRNGVFVLWVLKEGPDKLPFLPK